MSDPNQPLGPFGFLPCIKPVGMTSRDVVDHVQRQLRRETGIRKLKAGHTGTLDPLADGVVVIAVGAATRLTPWMLDHPKRYTGTFEWGATSESGDLEQTVHRDDTLPMPDENAVRAAAASIRGWIDQIPPTYSAIWIDGVRAFERVRRGESVDMPTRRVWIDFVRVLDYQPPLVRLDVRCGSGTYLRSLGMDLAERLGTTAVMTQLTRTHVGGFALSGSVDRSQYVCGRPTADDPAPCLPSALHTRLTDPVVALSHLRRRPLDDAEVIHLRYGLGVEGTPEPAADPLPAEMRCESDGQLTAADGNEPVHDDVVAIDGRGHLVAILRRKRGLWHPYRVFPPPQ